MQQKILEISNTCLNPKLSQGSCNAFRTRTISIHNYYLVPVLQVLEKQSSEKIFLKPDLNMENTGVCDVGTILQ
jgi:hypothetical protein